MSEQRIIGLEKKSNDQVLKYTSDALANVSPTIGVALNVFSALVSEFSRSAINQTIGAAFELSTRVLETLYVGIMNTRGRLLTAKMNNITNEFVQRVGQANLYSEPIRQVYLRTAASDFLKQMGTICPQVASLDDMVASLL